MLCSSDCLGWPRRVAKMCKLFKYISSNLNWYILHVITLSLGLAMYGGSVWLIGADGALAGGGCSRPPRNTISKLPSNLLSERMQSHTGYIWLTFLHCVISNVWMGPPPTPPTLPKAPPLSSFRSSQVPTKHHNEGGWVIVKLHQQ